MGTKVTLYGHGAYGTREWSIWNDGNVIKIHANGAMYEEPINEGKAGRSIEEQVDLRIRARIRSKLSQGFKRTRGELGDVTTNQLGFVSPMLAQHAKNARGLVPNNCYVQPKLDGHRCLINSEYAYSRGGKIIDTIPEIQSALNLPKGATIDGELYFHGAPLQTIASWAKRRQEATLNLAIHVYDVVMPNAKFTERLSWIQRNIKINEYVKVVDTEMFNPERKVSDYYMSHRRAGFEGAILRPKFGLYEPGKRSKTLLKVKMRFDDEFLCRDVIPDKVGNGVLILETKEGNQFKTVAPGPNFIKHSTLENKEKFIGKYVTCEYAELSIDKIPQHCVAIRWRNDI